MTILASAHSKTGHQAGYESAPGQNSEPKANFVGVQPPSQDMRTTRERIVVLMMMLVSAATATMFHTHFDYTMFWSGVLGCAVLGGFAALHTLKSRSSQIVRLRKDVARLEQEVGRLRTQTPGGGTKAGPAAGSGTPSLELGSTKARSNSTAATQPLGPLRAPPSASNTAATRVSPSHVPAPAGVAPGFSESAPERISPDARWEAPGLSRSVTSKSPANPETLGSSAAHAKPASPPDPLLVPAAPAAATPRTVTRPGTSALFEAPSWSGTSISSADPLRDAWSFRPKDAVEARSFAPDAEGAAEPSLRVPATAGTAAAQSHPSRGLEADLEMVQRKIKAMAEEVNAAESARLKPLSEPVRTFASNSPTLGAGSAPSVGDFGTAAMAIEDGISALKNAAGAMRSPAAAQTARGENSAQFPPSTLLPPADLLIPSTAQTIAVSAPPLPVEPGSGLRHPEPLTGSAPPPPEPTGGRVFEPRLPETRMPDVQTSEIRDRRTAEIAKAIEAKSMDVLLSPIVGLGDYAVTHFEVAVRLRSADGTHFDRPEEALTLVGDHLLALFSAERLSRTAAVADLLASRGKNGSVMSAATGASMSDANFLETFARVYETRNSISGQLVLTFSQADVEAFGSGTWQALSDMHSFGFRFALDQVTHLGMDFEYLAQCGFTFVKLPAQVFLKGLPSDSGFITVNDICRHLARCGLTLVVESVDDEALLARVFGFGALFGQGQLFGAPREISLDTLAPAQTAAA